MSRWDDVRAGRDAAEAKTPTEFENALRVLSTHPCWSTVIGHYDARVERETVDRTAPNVSALLLIEGRRTLLRDIKQDVARVQDAGPGRNPDPD
jgi:hypothetical protein